MRIKLLGIFDRGVANKERLYLQTTNDTNLNFYAVFDSSYVDSNSIISIPKNVYWFSSQEVKVGDQIILYTGPGENTAKANKDGTTSYFFYWRRPNTLWNKKDDCAILLELSSWVTSKLE